MTRRLLPLAALGALLVAGYVAHGLLQPATQADRRGCFGSNGLNVCGETLNALMPDGEVVRVAPGVAAPGARFACEFPYVPVDAPRPAHGPNPVLHCREPR